MREASIAAKATSFGKLPGISIERGHGPAGYRGVQGGGQSNENDLCFYSRQSLFSTVQVTEFQLP